VTWIALILICLNESIARADELVVWNVGQGLWVTLVSNSECDHFDAGGEIVPLRAIQKECGEKNNFASFSHWDWDHVGKTPAMRRLLPRLCLSARPGGMAPSHRDSLFDGIQSCSLPSRIHELATGARANVKSSNDSSRIFVADREVLLPGDASAQSEHRWRTDLLERIGILVLGHHGSKTSTSEWILRQMPKLKTAIASARKEKYGHPHQVVIDRLKLHGVALIRTEEWGSIHIELPPHLERNQRR
jgi:competence protein ComEC